MRRSFVAVLFAAALGSAAPLASAHAADPSAVWVQRKLHFVYSGFTSHFSCDGLRDEMKSILLQLGARKQDLQVQETGCTAFNRPEAFPGVQATFFALLPEDQAGAVKGEVSGQPIAAEWRTVELGSGRDALAQAGKCELIEQVKHKVLPLFATRNLQYVDNCVPHQLMLGGTTITVQALMPSAAGAAASPPPGASENLEVYPEKGQSAEQQARDREECHRWASSQGASASGADYAQAMRACLGARGYTVR